MRRPRAFGNAGRWSNKQTAATLRHSAPISDKMVHVQNMGNGACRAAQLFEAVPSCPLPGQDEGHNDGRERTCFVRQLPQALFHPSILCSKAVNPVDNKARAVHMRSRSKAPGCHRDECVFPLYTPLSHSPSGVSVYLVGAW